MKRSTYLRLVLPGLAIITSTSAGCKGDPDPIPECEEGDEDGGGDGTGAACDQPDPPQEAPTCADPEFATTPPSTPVQYTCEGRAGGAIVYNHKSLNVFGASLGGPGAVQTDPPVTEFPGDADVSACCYGNPPGMEITEGACRSDCGRAACNRILESLRIAADPDPMHDPSDGKCNPLVAENAIEDCRNNIRSSIESWIDQLEANYDACVAAAIHNSDPNLLYDDWSVPFGSLRKVTFADWGCSIDDWGCLHQAELRPFCEIDTNSSAGQCEMAGNAKDPAADGGGVDETAGDDGSLVGDPFLVGAELVSCSGTSCTVHQDVLDAVQVEFQVFYEEGVELTMTANGLAIGGVNTGEHSKAFLDQFSILNGDVIHSVNSTSLTTWSNVADVVGEIDTTSSWSVTIKRPIGGQLFTTLNYTITVGTAAAAGPIGSYQAGGARADSGLDGDADRGGSCACRTIEHATPPWALGVLLLGAVARPRRRK
jgi:MYXO-CTERM domain-containing protein